jgi:5-hydroxyisourate hydrolase-like protein (transthyretin family)
MSHVFRLAESQHASVRRFAATSLLRARSSRAHIACALLVGMFGVCASQARAVEIPIPNGSFTDAGNFGSVGGGLIGATGEDVPIGAGPWLGNYHGILGLLAPPTLTISEGAATISGIAAANLLGILNNGGSFTQTLSSDYVTGQRYTFSVDVDTGSLLDLSVLSSGNLGLALWNGDVMLASTATAPPELIDLQPVLGTSYQLSLEVDVTTPITGPIGVQLFAQPDQLIGVSLLSTMSFSNATLDSVALDPSSGSVIAVDATPQNATVGEPFANPLQVQVLDLNGDPMSGVTVTFAAPADGASAVLSDTQVMTDGNGFASITATANNLAGTYTVSASVEGVDTPASFTMTNTAGAAASTVAATGTVQSATVGTPFPDPLVVSVTDAFGNPVQGVDVTFAAPGSGASAILSAETVATDANGLAQVTATANDVVGDYTITATVDGIDPPASFSLSNRLDDGTTITDDSGDDQQASIGGAFACALTANVTDAQGAPLAGAAVDFVAPDTGASATLSNGVVSGSTVRATTDASGTATITATANDVAGEYLVTAQLVGSSAATIDFGLANVESLIFSSSFDTPCSASMF